MTQLRKPRRPEHGRTDQPHPAMPASPNTLVDGVCAGCRWPDRCEHDRICWTAGKKAVAAEKGYPVQPTLDGFPEWDGVGPVKYGVIPF